MALGSGSGSASRGFCSVGTRAGLDRGFTLIELMVVLVLLAILAAVIIPEMRGTYGHERLRSTGRDLLLGLNLAYSQAVTVQLPHRFLINGRENSYRVERPVLEEDGGLTFEPLAELTGASGRLAQGIEAEVHELEQEREPLEEIRVRPALRNGVEFFPDGTAEAKEIRVRDQDGYGLVLRINPVTGRVALEEMGRK